MQEPVCGEMGRYIIRPRAARNQVGKLMYILNSNSTGWQEYVQEVEVWECIAPGDSCGAGDIFPSLDTFCKQESTVLNTFLLFISSLSRSTHTSSCRPQQSQGRWSPTPSPSPAVVPAT